jgi:hypothetical protein
VQGVQGRYFIPNSCHPGAVVFGAEASTNANNRTPDGGDTVVLLGNIFWACFQDIAVPLLHPLNDFHGLHGRLHARIVGGTTVGGLGIFADVYGCFVGLGRHRLSPDCLVISETPSYSSVVDWRSFHNTRMAARRYWMAN